MGILMVLGLMGVTIYMAFGFPYTLFHLKQTDTTEIKAVFIVGRSGEKSPSPDSYFIGEEPPSELHKIGYGELTNIGKERMYLLGKFLKLRYYHLLLNGNPRKTYARAAALDRHLESAQALLAGLNPPKDSWFWSSTNELSEWQPKAVHSTATEYDDLLSIESNCFKLEQDKMSWKNSTRYQQLLNEFRHDLQTLRANTGLQFEDDLEMLSEIEDALRTRKAFGENVPAWYTSTFANRLGHIADVTTESRFNSASVQRLYVGRLLHEVAERINTKILFHQQVLANVEAGRHELADGSLSSFKQEPQLVGTSSDNSGKANTIQAADDPNIFVYITDKQRLAALMSSLQIYSSEPRFGSLLLIELHFDPINKIHFLRLFTISSSSPNSFPEPLRVNPIACMDSVECAPQQFEQNIRHLMLDRRSWQEACLSNSKPTNSLTTGAPFQPLITDDLSNQPLQEITVPPSTPSLVPVWTDAPTTITTSTIVLVPEVDTSSEGYTTNGEDKLEEELIVGPIKEVTPPIDVIAADVSSTAVATDASKEPEAEPTGVTVDDTSPTTNDLDSSTAKSPVEPIVVADSDKKQDIVSAIEFQNSPGNSLGESEDPGENSSDDIAGQEMLKVAEKEHFEKNYYHTSDI